MGGQKGGPLRSDSRMYDGFEPCERVRIAKHERAQRATVDAVSPGATRKGRLDRGQQGAVSGGDCRRMASGKARRRSVREGQGKQGIGVAL